MKKIFIISMAIIAATPLLADMVYDPVQNTIYSIPLSPNIDQSEYIQLMYACATIENNMAAAKGGAYPTKKEILNQFSYFLKKIGSATALRLLSDFNKNTIYYPNGTAMKRMWN